MCCSFCGWRHSIDPVTDLGKHLAYNCTKFHSSEEADALDAANAISAASEHVRPSAHM